MEKETYSVVVESGASDPTYTRWEEKAHCGHNHKTIESAEKCMEKLTRSYCNHGRVAGTSCSQCLGYAQSQSTSGKWWGARIHNQNGKRVEV